MSVIRTPPPTQSETEASGSLPTINTPQLQHYSSEPNLVAELASEFGTPSGSTPTENWRTKKRNRTLFEDETLATFMTEMRQMMTDFQTQQKIRYDKLFTVVDDIRSSVDFLIEKNKTLQAQVNKLESEKNANTEYITALETKLDSFERSARSTCIEIRNLPHSQPESKSTLVDSVIQIGRVLHVPISATEIKDAFRINNSKNTTSKTLIVDFTSVLLKEKFVSRYRKGIKENNRLTTEKLRISGPAKPVFVSENLTRKLKKLFFLAREHAKAHDFKFCWVSNGKIFLRKREGSPALRINSEADLVTVSDKK